jgi:hypothetical protein
MSERGLSRKLQSLLAMPTESPELVRAAYTPPLTRAVRTHRAGRGDHWCACVWCR